MFKFGSLEAKPRASPENKATPQQTPAVPANPPKPDAQAVPQQKQSTPKSSSSTQKRAEAKDSLKSKPSVQTPPTCASEIAKQQSQPTKAAQAKPDTDSVAVPRKEASPVEQKAPETGSEPNPTEAPPAQKAEENGKDEPKETKEPEKKKAWVGADRPTSLLSKTSDGKPIQRVVALPSVAKFMQDYKAEFLTKIPVRFHPRPFLNPHNNCYANSILQCLVGTSGFGFLMKKLVGFLVDPEMKNLPHIEDTVNLFADFRTFDANPKPAPKSTAIQRSIPVVHYDAAINPYSYYLPGKGLFSTFLGMKCQQDAQEFLMFLLNGLHEDFLKVMPTKSSEALQEPESEWNQAGSRKKTSVIITATEFPSSPITDLFGGLFKSTFKKSGTKASSSFEPFVTIPLEVPKIGSISLEASIKYFTSEERLDDEDESHTGRKQIQIERLPKVLILLLKRFIWTELTQKKITTHIPFPEHLYPRHFNCPTFRSPDQRYSLISVVSHHGRDLASGHYTSAVKYPQYDTWIRFDDQTPTEITLENVLQSQAYVLFYELQEQPKA